MQYLYMCTVVHLTRYNSKASFPVSQPQKKINRPKLFLCWYFFQYVSCINQSTLCLATWIKYFIVTLSWYHKPKIFLRPRLLSIRTTFFETNERMVNCFVFMCYTLEIYCQDDWNVGYNFANFPIFRKKLFYILSKKCKKQTCSNTIFLETEV